MKNINNIANIATSIATYIHKENPGLTNLEKSKISFGLECLLSELSKFITYFVIFWILSLNAHYWTAVAFICIPRMLAGGYHVNTYFGCFFVTLAGICTAVFGGVFLPIDFTIKLIIYIIALVITAIYAPIDHFNKPIISAQRRRNFKIYSIIVYIILGAIALASNSSLASVGIIGLLVEAISLPAGYYLQRR